MFKVSHRYMAGLKLLYRILTHTHLYLDWVWVCTLTRHMYGEHINWQVSETYGVEHNIKPFEMALGMLTEQTIKIHPQNH